MCLPCELGAYGHRLNDSKCYVCDDFLAEDYDDATNEEQERFDFLCAGRHNEFKPVSSTEPLFSTNQFKLAEFREIKEELNYENQIDEIAVLELMEWITIGAFSCIIICVLGCIGMLVKRFCSIRNEDQLTADE